MEIRTSALGFSPSAILGVLCCPDVVPPGELDLTTGLRSPPGTAVRTARRSTGSEPCSAPGGHQIGRLDLTFSYYAHTRAGRLSLVGGLWRPLALKVAAGRSSYGCALKRERVLAAVRAPSLAGTELAARPPELLDGGGGDDRALLVVGPVIRLDLLQAVQAAAAP